MSGRHLRPTLPRVLRALAGIAGAGGVFTLMLFASWRVVAGQSDGATVILEGQALQEGHLLLHGWTLSLDSFWSVDALFYAVATAIAGVRPELLHVVPAVIALLVVATSLMLATVDLRGRAGIVAVGVVAIVVCLPDRAFASFLVQGPLHVGTTLWCLAAFLLLVKRPGRTGNVVAGIFLVAGVLGDLQTAVLGIAPIIAVGLLEMRDAKRVRGASSLAVVGLASLLGAFVVHEVISPLGAFTLAKSNPIASGHQIIRNVGHLFVDPIALLGVTQGRFGPTGAPFVLRLFHVVVIAGLLVAIALSLRGLVVRLRRPPGSVEVSRLDDLLLFAIAADALTYVLFPIIDDTTYARYLTSGIVFSAILTGRLAGRWVTGLRTIRERAVLTAGCVLVALFGVTFGLEFRGPAAPSPVGNLSAFLVAHHLSSGVGDYWSSSIVTVETDGEVAVRPVVLGPQNRLVRYDKQSAVGWYSDSRFSFFVFNAGSIWNGVNRSSAIRTFGRPSRTYVVNTYRVLVYAHPFSVSPIGSQGP